MADEYLSNPAAFRLYTLDEYLDVVVDVIEHIRPDIYLERFVNQAPEEYLIAPRWGIKILSLWLSWRDACGKGTDGRGKNTGN